MFVLSIFKLLVIATCFALSLSLPSAPVHEVFETLHAHPAGWSDLGTPVDPSTIFTLRVHLKQQNVVEFEQRVYDMSTPGHASYGAHMTQTAINRMLNPTDETVALVTAWLSSAALEHKPLLDSNFLYINISISAAERLLDAKYAFYRNKGTGKVILRTLGYGLPVELHEHIDMIHPTIYFPSVNAMKTTTSDKELTSVNRRRSSGHAVRYQDHKIGKRRSSSRATAPTGPEVASCNATVTPACVKALYGFQNFVPPIGHGNKFAIAAYLEEYVQNDDLVLFEQLYANQTAGVSYSFVSVNGGLNTQNYGQDSVEAAIDIQYGISLNYPTPVSYYQTAGRPPFNASLQTSTDDSEPYLQWLTYMLALNENEIPQVVSTSYADEEQSVPIAYARIVCGLFAQLAARGVSALFATGDDGPGRVCISNDGKNATKFLPTFPASCPFVTAVGATQHIEPEQGVSFSGGGFSNYFSRPGYQERDVREYLERDGKKWAAYYNASGRAYPDVSAQGTNVSIIYWGGHRYEAGTSCSTPIFASIISLINAERLSRRLKPLGFLNPWLYGKGREGLVDIVTGGSTGCGSTYPGAQIPGAGWEAVVGWDPATGLGTPRFGGLLGSI